MKNLCDAVLALLLACALLLTTAAARADDPPASSAAASAAPPAATSPPATPPAATSPPAPAAQVPWLRRRTTGLGFAGAGAIGIGVSGILGLIAKASDVDALETCRAPGGCTQAAVDQSKRATTLGTVATAFFVAGAVTVAVGATIYFTASGGGVRGTF